MGRSCTQDPRLSSHEPRRALPGKSSSITASARAISGRFPDATITVKGDNPSCGDEVELAVKFTPDAVEALKFTGHGCAICMASASLMTIKIKGSLPRRSRRSDPESFREMLIAAEQPEPPETFGDLQVFALPRPPLPQRVKCATLAWRALEQALSSTAAASVSTEEENEGLGDPQNCSHGALSPCRWAIQDERPRHLEEERSLLRPAWNCGGELRSLNSMVHFFPRSEIICLSSADAIFPAAEKMNSSQ